MYGANDLTYNGNITNSSMKTFDVQCCALFLLLFKFTWPELSLLVACCPSSVCPSVCDLFIFHLPQNHVRGQIKKNKARRLHYLFEGELIWPHLFPKGNENALFTLILKKFQCIEPIFTRQGWQIHSALLWKD